MDEIIMPETEQCAILEQPSVNETPTKETILKRSKRTAPERAKRHNKAMRAVNETPTGESE